LKIKESLTKFLIPFLLGFDARQSGRNKARMNKSGPATPKIIEITTFLRSSPWKIIKKLVDRPKCTSIPTQARAVARDAC